MARTRLTKTVALGAYGTYGAGLADMTMTVADTVNDNDFLLVEGDIVVAHNTNVGAQTITLTSSDDPQGRTGDITTYSLAADDYAVFGPFKGLGWDQGSGVFHLTASSADVLIGIIQQV